MRMPIPGVRTRRSQAMSSSSLLLDTVLFKAVFQLSMESYGVGSPLPPQSETSEGTMLNLPQQARVSRFSPCHRYYGCPR